MGPPLAADTVGPHLAADTVGPHLAAEKVGRRNLAADTVGFPHSWRFWGSWGTTCGLCAGA